MVPILETKRLILHPLTLDDAPAVQRLFPKWDIVRFLSHKVPWPYPEDGALQFISSVVLPGMARGELWAWAIRLKNGPSHLIGSISVSFALNENRGFWLGLPWHGQGLMSEACEVVTEFWFNTLKCENLRTAKAVENIASSRISERQGARLVAVEEHVFVSGPGPAEIWELTRGEWNARRLATCTAEPSAGGPTATAESRLAQARAHM